MAQLEKISGTTPAIVTPKIPVEAVREQALGMVYRDLVVYLPAGLDFSTLRETPEVWRDVQKSSQSRIARGDHVLVYSHGLDQLLDTYCSAADDKTITLAPGRVLTMGAGVVSTFNDGKYRTAIGADGTCP